MSKSYFDNIKTKTMTRGNEKESAWPPEFGTGDKTPCYVKDGKVHQGYPPRRQVNDTAPMVIFDSMEPTYHHGLCRTIESRKEWQEADQLTGSATVTPKEFKELQERRPAIAAAKEREAREDRRKASIEAARAFRENKDEFYGKLKQRAEQQEKQAKKAGLTKLIKENI